ncbi:MAG TPA: FlgD immunoglobulin-like domain containing protein [Mycobacteriales bacterium]|nr:FlgD immunoglobulin-like domain containing protein [Mycobacteriales bacterium]
MPSVRALVAALAVAGLTLAGGLAPSAAHADGGIPDPPGEITLPALYGDQLPSVMVSGSPVGIAWQSTTYDYYSEPDIVHYSVYGGAQDADGGVAGDGEFTLVGSQLRGIPASSPQDGIDITTGDALPDAPQMQNSIGTGDGVFGQLTRGTDVGDPVWYDDTTAQATTFGPILIDGTSDPSDELTPLVADSQGAIVLGWGARGSNPIAGDNPIMATLDYLDFATGHYTVLDDTAYSESAKAAMNSTYIVWTHHGHALYLKRSHLSATPAPATPDASIDSMALNGNELAYGRDTGGGRHPDWTVSTGELGGETFTTVDTSMPISGNLMPADDGDFAVMAGDTVTDYGMYRLAPGSTQLGEPIVLFGPSDPLGIDASAGRIVSVVDASTAHPAQQRGLTATDASVTAASHSSVLIPRTWAGMTPDSAGGNTAYIKETGTGAVAVVLDGSAVVATYDVPDSAYDATISGRWLLVPYFVDHDHATAGAVAINLDTGASTAVPESEALYGDTEYFIGNGGVHALDLDTGAESVLPGSSACAGNPETSLLQAAGSWVFCDVSSADGASQAYNVTSGAVVAVPTTAAVGSAQDGVSDALLDNGFVAWIDATDRSVHLFDLVTQQDDVLGTAHRAVDSHQYLALNDDFVAWVASDDTTRVVPLGASSDAAPRYLGGITTTAFSPRLAGAAGDFRPELDTDRPLTGWTLTVRNAHGKLVRTLHGKAPEGNVRPSWNGRAASGKRAPDGVYYWTLTGTSHNGALVRASGAHKTISGTMRIDTVAPKASAHVGREHTVKGRREIAVRWSCRGSARCTYDIGYETRKAGSKHWSSPKRWLTRVSARSATFGAKRWHHLVKAHTSYRFVVHALDVAGNRSTPVVTRPAAR